MTRIRNYREEDYSLLKEWWVSSKEPAPTPELLPIQSTFILEDEGPVMSISVYFTNTKVLGILECFIKRPGYNNHEASKRLVEYAEDFAKSRGVKVLLCLSYKDKLKSLYQTLGYKNTVNNLSSFIKEL